MSHCGLCFIEATNYGEIFPNHELVFHDGHYKIVNDHDEIYRFPARPIQDPFDGKMDAEIENASKSELMTDDIYTAFVAKVRETFIFHPQIGHQIVELCKQVGYEPKEQGWLDYWICARAAKMIAQKTA